MNDLYCFILIKGSTSFLNVPSVSCRTHFSFRCCLQCSCVGVIQRFGPSVRPPPSTSDKCGLLSSLAIFKLQQSEVRAVRRGSLLRCNCNLKTLSTPERLCWSSAPHASEKGTERLQRLSSVIIIIIIIIVIIHYFYFLMHCSGIFSWFCSLEMRLTHVLRVRLNQHHLVHFW